MMETWAHGQDIVDAVGDRRVRRPAAPDRIVCATSPSSASSRAAGPMWTRGRASQGARVCRAGRAVGYLVVMGPRRRARSVSGPAKDFCVSSRSAGTSTTPRAGRRGRHAHEWLLYAQAFAGPPTDGPASRVS